jgi:hypothetical protein
MLLIYELYASLHFFWASFFIALYEFQSLVLWVRFARLYSFCFRHTEIKKQDRGNVKQYTGKVQN